jgi:hypothetical protein
MDLHFFTDIHMSIFHLYFVELRLHMSSLLVCIICTQYTHSPLKYFRSSAMPISVAQRSKARVCGRSVAGIVGSNLAGGMAVSLVSVVCFHVEVSAMG